MPADEARRQQALDEMAVLDTPAEHYLDTLVQLTQDLAQVDTVLISLIDRDRQWFKARVGLDVAETPRDVSFCGHAILGTEALVVADARQDRASSITRWCSARRSFASTPASRCMPATAQPIGTLCLLDPRPRQPGGRELRASGNWPPWPRATCNCAR
jgi:GAF domain-containing protein